MSKQRRTRSSAQLPGIEKCPTGIRDFGEPGIFMAFEETCEELTRVQLEAMQFKTAALTEEFETLLNDEQARLAAARGQAELARARGADGNGDMSKVGAKGHVDRPARPLGQVLRLGEIGWSMESRMNRPSDYEHISTESVLAAHVKGFASGESHLI